MKQIIVVEGEGFVEGVQLYLSTVGRRAIALTMQMFATRSLTTEIDFSFFNLLSVDVQKTRRTNKT
jgi:hypothetical protein